MAIRIGEIVHVVNVVGQFQRYEIVAGFNGTGHPQTMAITEQEQENLTRIKLDERLRNLRNWRLSIVQNTDSSQT